LEESENGVEIR